jgi:hypothetical protein
VKAGRGDMAGGLFLDSPPRPATPIPLPELRTDGQLVDGGRLSQDGRSRPPHTN